MVKIHRYAQIVALSLAFITFCSIRLEATTAEVYRKGHCRDSFRNRMAFHVIIAGVMCFQMGEVYSIDPLDYVVGLV